MDVLTGPMRSIKSSTLRSVRRKPVPPGLDSVTEVIASWRKSVVKPLIVFRVRRSVASYWNFAVMGPLMPVRRSSRT